MPQSCCICVVALSTINDYFLHKSKNRTDINKHKAYLSIRFSYKTKKPHYSVAFCYIQYQNGINNRFRQLRIA